MEPAAMKRMQSVIQNLEPTNWAESFREWDEMSLRDDLVMHKDYCAVGLANWSKLFNIFGGAPEIPIFYHHFIENDVKINKHDFEPIKVQVSIVESVGGRAPTKTCLVSKYLTAN